MTCDPANGVGGPTYESSIIHWIMAKGRLQENHSRPGEQPDQISTGQKALGGRCPEKNITII